MLRYTIPLFLVASSLATTGCVGLEYPTAKKPNFLLTSNGPTTVGISDVAVTGPLQSLLYSWEVSRCASLESSEKSSHTYVVMRHGGELKRRSVYRWRLQDGATIELDGSIKLKSGTLFRDGSVTPGRGDEVQADGTVLQRDGTIVRSDGKVRTIVQEDYVAPLGTHREVRSCDHPSIRDITAAEAAFRLMEDGFLLSDQVCSAYFSRIGNENQDLSYYRRTLNTISTAIASILGITESSAKSVSIVSTIFSQTETGIDNFAESFHFTPNFDSVHGLVARGQKVIKDQVSQPGSQPVRHTQAVRWIQAYQDVCQLKNIQSLVNQSVRAAQPTTPRSDSGDSITEVALSAAEQNDLLARIDETSISSKALSVYVAAATGIIPSNESSLIQPKLKEMGLKADPLKLDEVRTWLERLETSNSTAHAALLDAAKSITLTPPADEADNDITVDAAEPEAPPEPRSIITVSPRNLGPTPQNPVVVPNQ